MQYDIILADPPWDYKGQTQHAGKSSSNTGGAIMHYPTMTIQEMINTINVQSVSANNCLLFMWATWPHLDQAIQLGNGWGFKYVHTPFIWNKMKTNPGFYTLTQTEPVLCFKKGKIPTPRGARNIKQLVEVQRTTHSTKPTEVHDRIFAMFPTQRKLELFARHHNTGWDVWGNEVASTVTL